MMPEYINKQAVLNLIDELQYNPETNIWGVTKDGVVVLKPDALDKLRKAVKAAPPADVAPVVRCEDCRYCHRHADTGDYWCNKFAGLFTMVDLDDFCSRGERMDGGDQQCK